MLVLGCLIVLAKNKPNQNPLSCIPYPQDENKKWTAYCFYSFLYAPGIAAHESNLENKRG